MEQTVRPNTTSKRVGARDFESLKDFLHYQVEKSLLSSSGRKISNLETVARELGYKSPSILSMVLKGQRVPSEEMIQAMSNAWKLSASDREYFRLLVQIERQKKKGRDSSDTSDQLRRIAQKHAKAKGGATSFPLTQYHLVRDWYFFVIKQLVSTPSFVNDALWISRKLRKKISVAQARKAIELLVEAGIIRSEEESGKLKLNDYYTETTQDIPSEALRSHHKGMMQRATEALDEQAVDKRHFDALTFTVDGSRIPEIKARINEFMQKFFEEFDSSTADQVFQLNLQFFEHTREDGVVLTSASPSAPKEKLL